MSDTVVIGKETYLTHEEIAAELLAKPIEPPPPFGEDASHARGSTRTRREGLR